MHDCLEKPDCHTIEAWDDFLVSFSSVLYSIKYRLYIQSLNTVSDTKLRLHFSVHGIRVCKIDLWENTVCPTSEDQCRHKYLLLLLLCMYLHEDVGSIVAVMLTLLRVEGKTSLFGKVFTEMAVGWSSTTWISTASLQSLKQASCSSSGSIWHKLFVALTCKFKPVHYCNSLFNY